jgi:hypothetical protein
MLILAHRWTGSAWVCSVPAWSSCVWVCFGHRIHVCRTDEVGQPATDPWDSAHVLAPLVLGLVLVVVLFGHQWKIRKDGLFAHAIFA